MQVQGAAIYIDIAAPCTCPMGCLKNGVYVRFTGEDMAVRKKCIIFVETKDKYMLR